MRPALALAKVSSQISLAAAVALAYKISDNKFLIWITLKDGHTVWFWGRIPHSTKSPSFLQ